MLLSVIVTVYNSEKYLEKCVLSIANQEYKELEIILVNDGSTDKSGEICDYLATVDCRIKVYHTENHGQVKARIEGVRKACGEYIAFVDCDDWIEGEMYSRLMEICLKQDADLVTSGLLYEWKDKKKYLLDAVSEGIYEGEKLESCIWPMMIYDFDKNSQGILASANTKIFKRELLQPIEEKIDARIKYGEDGAIVYPYILNCKKIVVTDGCWYHYIQHEGSVINSYTYGSFEKIHILLEYFQNVFEEEKVWAMLEEQTKHYVRGFLRVAIHCIYDIELAGTPFMFPYELVDKGSRVVLYGAGDVGRSYWKCIKSSQYVTVVAWVDKKYQELIGKERVLEAPECIMQKEFDYIVIAIEDENVADKVREYLLQIGVENTKIVWKINRVRGY